MPIGQGRLNNLMTSHIHHDFAGLLNMVSFGNEFIQGGEVRQKHNNNDE